MIRLRRKRIGFILRRLHAIGGPLRVIAPPSGKPIKAWADEIEAEAEKQLRNIAGLPFIYKHVAVMPDVHYGIGATVGSVIATKEAVIPAAVGVDIGCGMAAVRTNLTSRDFGSGDAAAIRHSIERGVPVGFRSHNEPRAEALRLAANAGLNKLGTKELCQLGTLGGGNHFIEMCTDQDDRVWIVLHSGSRNLGKRLAEGHIDKAKKIAEQHFVRLSDPNLAFFSQGTSEFDAYKRDVEMAQDYAMINRRVMLAEIMSDVSHHFEKREVAFDDPINCHHNYLAFESHFGENVIVTRKGAIRARPGDLGIIPGSMGTRSYIVEGKGNPESFMSCSHGAGRRMSRTQAKKTFTVADLAKQTAGVECRKDKDVIDEIPGAYKDIDDVMALQADLVTIRHTLKQFMCVKG